MNNLKFVKFAMWLSSCTFWTAVLVVFLESRGLELSEVYQLISIYSIGIVILEYPTGVVGDYISHKLSTIAGYLVMGSGLVLLSIAQGYYAYLGLMLYLALGWSLSSGSDNALLHSVSSNFKKDFADTRSGSLVFRMVAISLGGLMAAYSLAAPAVATGIVLVIAAILLLFVRQEKVVNEKGDIFALAKQGLLDLRKNKKLRSLVMINAIIAGFFISYKWYFNPMFENIGLPLEFWGFMISFATLAQAFGARLTKKYKEISIPLLFSAILVFVLLSGIYTSLIITLVAVTVLMFLRGVIETELTIQINEQVKESHRAGTQSFSSLISRLFSSLYLLIAGYVLDYVDIFWLMVLSVLILLVIVGGLLIGYGSKKSFSQ